MIDMRKKCDMCKESEELERPFIEVLKETIKTYQPTRKDFFYAKSVIRTKKVHVCQICFLKKIKKRRLTSEKAGNRQ